VGALAGTGVVAVCGLQPLGPARHPIAITTTAATRFDMLTAILMCHYRGGQSLGLDLPKRMGEN